MSLRASLAGAMQFAHLVTPRAAAPVQPAAEIVPPAARADDGDEEDMKKQLEDAEKRAEDAEKRADDAEERAKQAEKKAKKGKKAEGAASETDEEEDENGDEDSDREEAALPAGNSIRAARMRERSRCAAIFSDPAAGGNPALAAQLAFAGNIDRVAAIGILKAAGTGRPAGLDARMAGVKTPVVTPDAPAPDASDPKVIAEGIIKNYEQARGLVRSK